MSTTNQTPPAGIRIERVANGFVVIPEGFERNAPMLRADTLVFNTLDDLCLKLEAWWGDREPRTLPPVNAAVLQAWRDAGAKV
jgi:hypothetical protein